MAINDHLRKKNQKFHLTKYVNKYFCSTFRNFYSEFFYLQYVFIDYHLTVYYIYIFFKYYQSLLKYAITIDNSSHRCSVTSYLLKTCIFCLICAIHFVRDCFSFVKGYCTMNLSVSRGILQTYLKRTLKTPRFKTTICGSRNELSYQ